MPFRIRTLSPLCLQWAWTHFQELRFRRQMDRRHENQGIRKWPVKHCLYTRISSRYRLRLPLCHLSRSLTVPSARAACLHSMLCARFSRTRSFTLRSSTDRPLPVLTPVAATVSQTTKSHHACSAERADQVTYSGDPVRAGACNYSKRRHIVSPSCGGSTPPHAQNLERAAAGAF